MISVQVYGAEEIAVRLDSIPAKLRAMLRTKFENIFQELTREFFEGVPGKFLDPKQIETGITEQGGLLIGYIEYGEKDGVYAIYPVNKPFLYNLKTGFFAHEVHRHPFPKGATSIEQKLLDAKPWIEAELEGIEVGEL